MGRMRARCTGTPHARVYRCEVDTVVEPERWRFWLHAVGAGGKCMHAKTRVRRSRVRRGYTSEASALPPLAPATTINTLHRFKVEQYSANAHRKLRVHNTSRIRGGSLHMQHTRALAAVALDKRVMPPIECTRRPRPTTCRAAQRAPPRPSAAIGSTAPDNPRALERFSGRRHSSYVTWWRAGAGAVRDVVASGKSGMRGQGVQPARRTQRAPLAPATTTRARALEAFLPLQWRSIYARASLRSFGLALNGARRSKVFKLTSSGGTGRALGCCRLRDSPQAEHFVGLLAFEQAARAYQGRCRRHARVYRYEGGRQWSSQREREREGACSNAMCVPYRCSRARPTCHLVPPSPARLLVPAPAHSFVPVPAGSVFSDRYSPTQWAGPKHFTRKYRPFLSAMRAPPCSLKDVSEIDALVILHNHHDQYAPSESRSRFLVLSVLQHEHPLSHKPPRAQPRPHVFAPIGNAAYFRGLGIPAARTHCLDSPHVPRRPFARSTRLCPPPPALFACPSRPSCTLPPPVQAPDAHPRLRGPLAPRPAASLVRAPASCTSAPRSGRLARAPPAWSSERLSRRLIRLGCPPPRSPPPPPPSSFGPPPPSLVCAAHHASSSSARPTPASSSPSFAPPPPPPHRLLMLDRAPPPLSSPLVRAPPPRSRSFAPPPPSSHAAQPALPGHATAPLPARLNPGRAASVPARWSPALPAPSERASRRRQAEAQMRWEPASPFASFHGVARLVCGTSARCIPRARFRSVPHARKPGLQPGSPADRPEWPPTACLGLGLQH
ncbi:hypothetical protein B0H15DRAFT_803349 [Mycena belliarum]|uniref:Uncharacterized protein n=1 Tax=Mycena belliarum TaxID=1033014 RepID=A0AAD6XNJ3_9AGAR|nr:hypothetical protein B0H15DRAFT_803349 [Mycena belliae]